MSQVKEIIVPRCYHFNRLEDPIVTIELHGFSDSSILAYGGCIISNSSHLLAKFQYRLLRRNQE